MVELVDEENHAQIQPAKTNHTSMDAIRQVIPEDQQKSISWHNINYKIQSQNRKGLEGKIILNNISGSVDSGHFLAIMGPTGSGKSSLLNVLAGRVQYSKNSSLTGAIRINGELKVDRTFRRISAYVTQDDILYSHLTVKETLMTAANFSLPKKMSKVEKEELVLGIIKELGLLKAANTIIGNQYARGVSGGERRRVNIGVELISQPTILFLDEPTSGLDSFQAQSVMEAVKTMAQHGRTIISSIHQPRSSIYAMFDYLLLLTEGRVVYHGLAKDAVSYFAQLGFECPALYNPADYFLDIVSPDYRSYESEKSTKSVIGTLAKQWGEDTNENQPIVKHNKIQSLQVFENTKKNIQPIYEDSIDSEVGYKSSWLDQFIMIYQRSFKQTSRNRFPIIVKVLSAMFFGLVLGALYSEINYSEKSIQDRIGIIFFAVVNQAFAAMFPVLTIFSRERKIVERERASKSYHISAYYLAKVAGEIPFNIIGPFVFGVIVYWIVGLNPSAVAFFKFILVIELTCFLSIALGMIVSSFAKTEELAQVLGNPILVVLLLFGGFYINIKSIPIGARWVTYLSLFKWCFQGLIINEFEGETFKCDGTSDDASCIRTGEEVISDLSFEDETFGSSILGIFILLIASNILSYLFLRFRRVKFQPLINEYNT